MLTPMLLIAGFTQLNRGIYRLFLMCIFIGRSSSFVRSIDTRNKFIYRYTKCWPRCCWFLDLHSYIETYICNFWYKSLSECLASLLELSIVGMKSFTEIPNLGPNGVDFWIYTVRSRHISVIFYTRFFHKDWYHQ